MLFRRAFLKEGITLWLCFDFTSKTHKIVLDESTNANGFSDPFCLFHPYFICSQVLPIAIWSNKFEYWLIQVAAGIQTYCFSCHRCDMWPAKFTWKLDAKPQLSLLLFLLEMFVPKMFHQFGKIIYCLPIIFVRKIKRWKRKFHLQTCKKNSTTSRCL